MADNLTAIAAWIGATVGVGNLLWSIHRERRGWKASARDQLPLIELTVTRSDASTRVRLFVTNRLQERLEITKLTAVRGTLKEPLRERDPGGSLVVETFADHGASWSPKWVVHGEKSAAFVFVVQSTSRHGPEIKLLLNSSLSTIRDRRVTLKLTNATIAV